MADKENRVDPERLAVIRNIAHALEEGDVFRKVELNDPRPTEEDIKRVILPFDNLRRGLKGKILSTLATGIAVNRARGMSESVRILGSENLRELRGGAIMTSNHYSPIDSLPPRLAVMQGGGGRGFYVVVQESNVFMRGFFGFLMRNCNTLPVSKNLSYMARNLKPAITELMRRGEIILIYPEAEMWFNYKRPREYMDGAYYYAVETNSPILPCFTTFEEGEGFDAQGMHNLLYTFHIMPPIYPDLTLPKRERREKMRECDRAAKISAYESVYGAIPEGALVPHRDIAGLPLNVNI